MCAAHARRGVGLQDLVAREGLLYCFIVYYVCHINVIDSKIVLYILYCF